MKWRAEKREKEKKEKADKLKKKRNLILKTV